MQLHQEYDQSNSPSLRSSFHDDAVAQVLRYEGTTFFPSSHRFALPPHSHPVPSQSNVLFSLFYYSSLNVELMAIRQRQGNSLLLLASLCHHSYSTSTHLHSPLLTSTHLHSPLLTSTHLHPFTHIYNRLALQRGR